MDSSNSLQAIRASAGSGKTYALTTRYLRMFQRDGKPDGILATTFTRKAAGEILGRVLKRLAEAADGTEAGARLAAELHSERLSSSDFELLLERLCRSLHRVSISTLDSFFHRLAGSFRHDLGLPGEMMLVEEDSPEIARLRMEAIRRLLTDGDRERLLSLLNQLHQNQARREVSTALDTLIQSLYSVYLEAPDLETWQQLLTPERPETGEIRRCMARLREMAGGMTDKRFPKAIRTDLDRVEAEEWKQFLASGLAPKVMEGAPKYYQTPIPPDLPILYDPLIRLAKAELLGALARQTEATYRFLREFDEHFSELRRQHRLFLFSDLPRELAALLPDRDLAEIAYRLDAGIEHLLLDEFQDTSPRQWEILRPFARRISSDVNGNASFFCVGDIKQAIYGWRGGCAEIFNELDADVPDLAWASTETSYRSSQVVLDAVNAVFSRLEWNAGMGSYASDAIYWQSQFREHRSARTELPGYVELVLSPVPSDADMDADSENDDLESDSAPETSTRASHEEFAARKVADLAARYPQASIGVLMRTNQAVRQMLFRLQQQGVAASGEGGTPVADDPAVEAFLSAFTLADHPGDSAAAFHVAHSPLGAVLGLEREAWSDGASVARTARAIRERLLSDGYAATITDWLRRVSEDCQSRSVQRLTQLVELADAYERRATLRPADFVRYVRATPVEEPTPARVRVMSIHKSKGLEFDIVVLPELHKKVPGQYPQVVLDRATPTSPVRAVYRAGDKETRALDPGLRGAYERQISGEIRESLCLLYVAMTRARHALHMIVKPGKRDPIPLRPFSHAAILCGELGNADEPEDETGARLLYRSGDPNWPHAGDSEGTDPEPAPPVAVASIKLARHSEQPARTWTEITPSSLENEGRVRAPDLLLLEDTEGQLRGSVMHLWFEQITWLELGLPPDSELLRLARAVAPGKPDEWHARQLARFHRSLRSDAVRSVLTCRPEWRDAELWREQRFVVYTEGRLIRGVFDRVVIERDVSGRARRVTLIDFKSDRVEAADVPRRAEIYRPQLQAYRMALAAQLGVDQSAIDAWLVFMESGCIQSV